MRIRRPYFAKMEDVKIAREGERAIIIYNDRSIPPTELWLGQKITGMSDAEILHQHNSIIVAQGLPPEEWRVLEIPPGRPQIDYDPRYRQWMTRGETLRCQVVDGGTAGEPMIRIDGHELSLEEFGKLLATHAGWGMRITFVPEDALLESPDRMLWDPPMSTGASPPPERDTEISPSTGPSIEETFASFLRAMNGRYSSATVSRYRKVIDQFRDHLDNCGPLHLTPEEEDRLNSPAEPDAPASFCRIFGPDKIFKEIGGFLEAYTTKLLPVSASIHRSLPATLKNLSNWLAECEYIDEMTRRSAVQMIASSADKVQRAHCVIELLRKKEEERQPNPDLELEGSHYRVVHVERTTLRLADPLGLEGSGISVDIPAEVGQLVEEDWVIECHLGLIDGSWQITSISEVHPR